MLGGEQKKEIDILVYRTPEKHSEEFFKEIDNIRLDIITSIVLRLAIENKI